MASSLALVSVELVASFSLEFWVECPFVVGDVPVPLVVESFGIFC